MSTLFQINAYGYPQHKHTFTISLVCNHCHKSFDVKHTGTDETLGAYLRSFDFICDKCKGKA